ncbi:transcriptional antiterminator, BglG family [Gracilibacillus ureilyticus]|uniref:Transcriptional antiterminator, BglG family n=1 Tax=Gracilibacillus ureilyticus TaxID=531814 RepID=A0A1H9T8D9_9BACI|nr:PRD domain-containing protein [Gracilibacillus ureilyticus]SER93347.1 transcriptional antiterminator, BglG family [Gracilibacillus ureilyticus]
MLIRKIFNNNVVLAEAEGDNELILMGRGIAFQKKVGDLIDKSKVDKKFVQGLSNQLSELLVDIPQSHLDLAIEIIQNAKSKLSQKLSEYIYLTLTDHLDFAITRTKNGQILSNPLLWEIKKTYPTEYKIGQSALETVKDRLGIVLPEDEAGSIALHLVNAQNGVHEMDQTIEIAEIVQDILQIVKYQFGIDFNEDSINYSRFVVHLRFFGQRLLEKQTNPHESNDLFEIVREKYPNVYDCVEVINGYLKNARNTHLSKSEMVYLMLHIQRVTDRSKK